MLGYVGFFLMMKLCMDVVVVVVGLKMGSCRRV